MAQPRNSGYCISAGCPGCGGALHLQSDFLTTRCEHCQSVVRIHPSPTPHAFLLKPKVARLQVRFHLDRYLKAAGKRLSSPSLEIEGVYAPYWQVEGILLRLRHRKETRYEISDWERGDQVTERPQQTTEVHLSRYAVTFPADAAESAWPASLGVRTQIALLYPFAAEHGHEDFAPLPLRLPPSAAIERARQAAGNLDRVSQDGIRRNQSRLFATRLSVVYLPYFECRSGAGDSSRFVVDAINGEVSESIADSSSAREADSAIGNFGALQVDLHQCPNCGHALVEDVSYFQVCPECNAVITLDGDAASKLSPMIFENHHDQNATLFPFYVFEVVASDAERLRRALRCQNDVARLIVPAFQLGNFESLYRLSARISTAAAQSTINPLAEWPQRFAPVTVSTAEAQAFATAVFARSLVGKDDSLTGKSFSLAANQVRLMFAAFRADGYFFVDEALGAITFERAALKT